MRVISQANAFDPKYPADAAYVENVMWEQSKTVFVTLNIPGGSNNDADAWNGPGNTGNRSVRAPGPHAGRRPLVERRRSRWRRPTTRTASSIIGQADMWDVGRRSPITSRHYEPIIFAMAYNAMRYGEAGAVTQRRLAYLSLGQSAVAELDVLRGRRLVQHRRVDSTTRITTCRTSTGSSCTDQRSRWSG